MKRKTKKFIKRNLWWMILLILITLGIIFWSQIILFFTSLIPQQINNQTGNGNTGGSSTSYSCTDSDAGLSYYMVGHVIDQDNLWYYDNCESSSELTEYYCSNDRVSTRTFNCPPDYECLQTRSGGYCNPPPQGTNGDIVGTGSGSGGITGGFVPAEVIDMDSLGLIPGNCGLKMLLNTEWSYANPDSCQGIQGAEGLIWQVYDSNTLYWTRTDTSPTGLGTELNCGMDYDGIHDWRIMVGKTLNIPNCNINYEYDYKIVLCNCQ